MYMIDDRGKLLKILWKYKKGYNYKYLGWVLFVLQSYAAFKGQTRLSNRYFLLLREARSIK